MIAKKYLAENYACSEYIEEYERGYYQSEAYLQLVLPLSDSAINEKHQYLVIGHAGTDGIEFCYRVHEEGIWTFYPIEETFERIAPSIQQLINGWKNGSIKV